MAAKPRSGKVRSQRQVQRGLAIKITIVAAICVAIAIGGLLLAFEQKQINWKLIGPVSFVLLLLGSAVAFFFALTITKPVQRIVSDVIAMANGDYSKRSKLTSNDEIGVLASAVNELAESLQEAEESKDVVSQIKDDMSVAGEIQQLLLPDMMPKIPTVEIYPHYQPAGKLGGDYYDFIPVDPDHLGIVIADVSGKGISGSMIMGIFRSILRRFAENNTSTLEVLVKTNELLSRDIKRGLFVTAYYIILDIRTNKITFSCAGHTPMIIYRATSGSVELVKPNGMALGFDTGLVFNRQIQQHELRLMPGDRVMLYTDGVIDTVNRRGDKFGENRFYKAVKDNAGSSSKELLREVVAQLDDFRGRAEPADDVTMVTFRIN